MANKPRNRYTDKWKTWDPRTQKNVLPSARIEHILGDKMVEDVPYNTLAEAIAHETQHKEAHHPSSRVHPEGLPTSREDLSNVRRYGNDAMYGRTFNTTYPKSIIKGDGPPIQGRGDAPRPRPRPRPKVKRPSYADPSSDPYSEKTTEQDIYGDRLQIPNTRFEGRKAGGKIKAKKAGGKVKSYKKGGKVRGAGIAKRGTRKCKMR